MREIVNELRSPRYVAWGLILGLTAVLWYRYPFGTYQGRDGVPRDYALTLKAWDTARQGGNPYRASALSRLPVKGISQVNSRGVPAEEDPAVFKHSPGTLTLVGLMPRDPVTSWLVMGTFSLLLFAASLGFGARYTTWKSVVLVFLGWALAWRGLLETLESGQLEVLIFGLAVASAALLRRNPLVCGLIAGTLPWIKLPWILLLLPLTLVNVPTLQGKGKKVRRVRMVISGYFLSWLLWGAVIPSLVFGQTRSMAITGQWIDLLVSQPAALYFSRVNQSVWSGAMRLIGDDPLLGLGLGTCFAGAILGVLIVKGMRMLPNRAVLAWLAPWLLVIQLLSPLSWRTGSVFALAAPFSISLTEERTRWLRYPLLAVALVLMLLQLNPVLSALAGQSWTSLYEYGVFTAFWGVLLLLSL